MIIIQGVVSSYQLGNRVCLLLCKKTKEIIFKEVLSAIPAHVFILECSTLGTRNELMQHLIFAQIKLETCTYSFTNNAVSFSYCKSSFTQKEHKSHCLVVIMISLAQL